MFREFKNCVCGLAVTLLALQFGPGCTTSKQQTPSDAPLEDSKPRDSLATIRQLDRFASPIPLPDGKWDKAPPWLDVSILEPGGVEFVMAFENQTLCYRKWVPRRNTGYILFRSGTAQPVGWFGDLGSCVKEPPIPREYQQVEQLRCYTPPGTTVRIHGYSWPDELNGELDGEALSRRRVNLLRNRLGSMALPNSISEWQAHGTAMSNFSGTQKKSVVGIAFVVETPEFEGHLREPQFRHSQGPPLPDHIRQQIRDFLAKNKMRGVPADQAEDLFDSQDKPALTVRQLFESPIGSEEERVFQKAIERDELLAHDLARWIDSMIDGDCQPTALEAP